MATSRRVSASRGRSSVNGPSTAAALAERLDLTPAAVRRHLDQLVEEGAVEAREPRSAAPVAAVARPRCSR